MAARSRFSENVNDLFESNDTLVQVEETESKFFAFSSLDTFYKLDYIMTSMILGQATIGILPNVANIIVFAKMGFSETINIMFCVLSVADLTYLLANLVSTVSINLGYRGVKTIFIDPYDLSLIINPVGWATFSLGSCATALIAVERSVCIAMPLKVKSIFTRGRVLVAIVFFCSLTAGNLLMSYSKMIVKWHTDPITNQTGLIQDYTEQFRYWVTISMFTFSVAPSTTSFFIVGVGTVFLVFKLNQNAKWRASVSSSGDTNKVSMKEVKVVRSATLVCIVYIVCFSPNVGIVFASIIQPRLHIADVYYGLFWYICFYVAYLFQSFSSSFNIFIYLTTSSRYKQTFMSTFGRCKSK